MADPAESTFRLVYRSHVRIPPEKRKAELGSIFSSARSNNKRHGVTGALLVWQEWFVQTLEGEESTVRGLYDTIYGDARHEHVTILEQGDAPTRSFGRWSMARVSDDDEPDIPLLMNRDKGGASPAAPRAITPDEETALAAMREYARAGAGQSA